MDALAKRTIEWVEIPSVTGTESQYGDALAAHCQRMGLAVEQQELAPGRRNVLARGARPQVVVCTHIDTVPGDLPISCDGVHIYGRGSCDAKGPAVALLAAVEELLQAGEDRIGCLFTVDEEAGSAGAALANMKLAEPWRPRWILVGEPTDNRFVAAGKGVWKAKLVAQGVAGHSSQNVGPSAIHELVGCCAKLLREDYGQHPVLGPSTLNIGTIQGGIASNVVAPHAECEVMVRTATSPEFIRERIERNLGAHVRIDSTYKSYGPLEFEVPAGEQGIGVAFGTDVPHLSRWGTPLLMGPGSILDAHTVHEKVAIADLLRAKEQYKRALTQLLARLEVSA
jgi:acetylornithine deacetylase